MNDLSLEQKYKYAILALKAIAQHKGGDEERGFTEWTQAEAFCDCRQAAYRCLLKLGEETHL